MSERFEDLPSEEAQDLMEVIADLIALLNEQAAIENGNDPRISNARARQIYRRAKHTINDLARQV